MDIASKASAPSALSPAAAIRLMGEPTRLRILALLDREELSVGELSRCLALSQSRVSNHLRPLREADLLVERHLGSSTFLRSALTQAGTGLCHQLWQALHGALPGMEEYRADRERLREVLRDRTGGDADFFDRIAVHWDTLGVDFASGQARQRALASLLGPGLTIADLGCGTGYLARALAGLASRVICVDRSGAMLDEARRSLEDHGTSTQFDFRPGGLDQLPIADGELDGAVASMVLHHLASPEEPLAEMFRTLRPGGCAVILELAPHSEKWLRSTLGDRHLGLEARDVADAFRRAGFLDVAIEAVDDAYTPCRRAAEHAPSAENGAQTTTSLPLYLVRGRKPSDTGARGTPGPDKEASTEQTQQAPGP
jgi:ArsR family transcriptional regulator